MDNMLTILCDICKKRPYITTIDYKGNWVGVCKICKKEIEKREKHCCINKGD
jgi:hypothetical protein